MGWSSFSYSQRLVDKLGFYFAPGVVIIPGKENLTPYLIPKNAFGSFKPGISLNLCLLYNKNDRISYGIDGQFFMATKPNHVLVNTAVGPVLKFNITSSFNKVSPFLLGGLKFGYTYINRSEYSKSEQPASSTDGESVEIKNLNFKFGYAKFAVPCFGALAGAGLDFTISKRLKIFVMGSYTYQFEKSNSFLKDNFPENNGNLSFITGEAGINYRLAKPTKNKKNINNLNAHKAEHRRQQTMKKIAMASAKKNVTQKMPSINTAQSEIKPGASMKFKTLSKEGLDPNKRYAVNGQVQGDGQKLDDISVLILDEKGKVVGTAKPDKNGRFAYNGLKPDNYSIALNKNDPRLKADANMSEENPGMKVGADALNKFAYNRLSNHGKPAGIVIGDAKLGDNGQAASDQTMLLLDNKGNVEATTKTDKNGKYAFKNLKSDNYQVVAADNPNVKATAVAASGDPSMQVDEVDFKQFGFKKLANGQHLEPVITGKVNSSGDSKNLADQSVLILDENGNVVGKTTSNKEGRFAFKGLTPDNYQAVLENGNPAVSAKVSLSATDPSLQMPENSFFKFGKLGAEGSTEKFITGKVDLSAGSQNNGDATVLLLDDKGNVVESAKVNKDGNFVIKNVRSSNYQVVVEGADYDKMVFDVGKNDKVNASLAATAFNNGGTIKTNTDGTPQNLIVGKIDMGSATLPEQGANVVLVDDKGNAVERATSDKEGNFVFKNVRAANYQAVVEGQDYKKVVMEVENGNTTAKVSANDFIKHGFNKPGASVSNNIVVGKVTSNVAGKSVEDKTVLLLDDKGKVVGKTVVKKDGSFTFNDLKMDNYQTVLEKPDASIKTSLAPMIKDPDMKIFIKDIMKYNPITNSMEKLSADDHVVITGTIRSDDFIGAESRTVMLIDDEGNVVKEVMSDKSGVFKFQGIKAKDYQVIYQDGDKKVNPTIQMYKDNNPGVTEEGGKIAKTLFYSPNEFKLNEKDKAELEKFVKYYKEHPNVKMIKLNAYGDATGTDQANMEITKKRADQVLEYLEKRGVPQDKLKMNPMGKSLKFKNKYNVPDHKLNRKVDIEIVE